MTQDEIIQLAREAGPDWWLNTTMLERFAALVAANAFNDGFVKGNKGLMEAVREEREACAKVCEEVGPKEGALKLVTEGFAAAIRARGDK